MGVSVATALVESTVAHWANVRVKSNVAVEVTFWGDVIDTV
jgi:hypothetical protein